MGNIMPMEEDEKIIRLKEDKTLVCEVSSRRVVISSEGGNSFHLERDEPAPDEVGNDVLKVSGVRVVKTGGETDHHNGNVVIRVKGDYTLHVTGNLTIEAGGSLQLKSQRDLSLDAMHINVKAKANLSQKATMIETRADARQEIHAGAMLDLKGGIIKIN